MVRLIFDEIIARWSTYPLPRLLRLADLHFRQDI